MVERETRKACEGDYSRAPTNRNGSSGTWKEECESRRKR